MTRPSYPSTRRLPLVLTCAVLAGACGTTVPAAQRAGTSAAGAVDGLSPAQAPALTSAVGDSSLPRSSTPLAGPVSSSRSTSTTATDTPQPGAVVSSLPPVQIGIITQDSSGALGASLGFKAADNGNESAFAKIVIDDINAHGGLRGRRVVPVVYNIDASQYGDNVSIVAQRACARFTQDHKVVAALVSWHMRGVHEFEACMEKARAVTIDPNGVITGDAALLGRYPHFVTPNGVGADRVASLIPAGVAGTGYFAGRAPVGVLADDTPQGHRAIEDHLKPALARVGANLKHVAYIAPARSTADAGRLSNDLASAVLRFRTDGVTRVMDLNGTTLLFAAQAESQQYRPRYAMTSSSAPAALTANGVPAAQLKDAVGMGWMPVYDVNTLRANETPSGQRRCLDLMRAKGQTLDSATVLYTALTFCEEARFLQALTAVAPASGALTGDLLRAAFGHVVGYPSALGFGTSITASRRDGGAAVRTFRFEDGCTCFRYTTAAPVSTG